jgi:ribosomal protein S19
MEYVNQCNENSLTRYEIHVHGRKFQIEPNCIGHVIANENHNDVEYKDIIPGKYLVAITLVHPFKQVIYAGKVYHYGFEKLVWDDSQKYK